MPVNIYKNVSGTIRMKMTDDKSERPFGKSWEAGYFKKINFSETMAPFVNKLPNIHFNVSI